MVVRSDGLTMRGPGGIGERVTCLACGREVAKREAREYDKYGDRWERRRKRFEYLCRSCHAEITHQPRDGLEATLVEINAGSCDRETFLRRYREAVEGRRGRHGDR